MDTMRWKALAVVTVLCLAQAMQPVAAATETEVAITAPAYVKLDTPCTVNVTVDPVEALGGMECGIRFNASVLEVQEVEGGELFEEWWNGSLDIDNNNGTISQLLGFNYKETNTTEPGVFASVTFTATGEGWGWIRLVNVSLSDPNGTESVPYHASNDTIIVDGMPPEITDNTPDTATTGDEFTFNATVEDNLQVENVAVEYRYGDGDHENVSMEPGSDYMKTITVQNTTENLSYIMAAKDSAGNWDHTTTTNVTVVDNNLPSIDTITGYTTGTTGETTTISTTFSDNIGVTNATLYYRVAGAGSWNTKSILNGSAAINVPSDSSENWYYYVTVNDAAGNGPVGDPSTDGSSYYTITVTNEDNDPPSIDTITGDTTGTTGETTTITATFSDNIDVTNATLYYKTASANSWSSTSILSGSAGIAVKADSIENWHYYVTVNDAAGNGPVGDPSTDGSSYYTIAVTDNDPPSVTIDGGPSGTIGASSGMFTWSGSDNVGGLHYRYKLTGGWTSWSTGTTSYSFSGLTNGAYTFSVQAQDDAGLTSNTATRSFTVNTTTPPNADFSTSPEDPTDMQSITFDASASTDGDIVNYTWAFGDGATAYGETATHTYDDSGNYTVTLTVTDDRGDTDTVQKVVPVNDPPTAAFDLPHEGVIGSPVNVTDRSSDSDGHVVNWTWRFGDGSKSHQRNTSHTYTGKGTYTVTLHLTDNHNATDSSSHTVTIKPRYDFSVTGIDCNASLFGAERITVSIENSGGKTANGVACKLFIDGAAIETKTSGAVAPDGTATLSYTVDLSPLSGHTIRGVVDPDDEYVEGNEDDNEMSARVSMSWLLVAMIAVAVAAIASAAVLLYRRRSQPEAAAKHRVQVQDGQEIQRCFVCRGKLKADAAAVQCECGNIFHRSCAKRVGECPDCGREFDVGEAEDE